jgi:hypothetical protein
LLVRDPLDRFLWDGSNEGDLGEFGQWAIAKFGRDGGSFRGNLERVSSYAKVEGIEGEVNAAIGRATRDVQLALLILKVIYHEHAGFFERERFGTFGTFFDPTPRFGLMGSLPDDVRITLYATSAEASGPGAVTAPAIAAAPSGPILGSLDRPLPAVDYVDRLDRIGIATPVRVAEQTLSERWPIIEELAAAFWPVASNWSRLATAVRWFVDGTDASTQEDAFVKYATAIDVLMGGEERGYVESMTTRISERLAFLIGSDDPLQRDRIFKACQEFFHKRGRIVHGGATTTEQELWRFEGLARLAILRMAWEIKYRGYRDVNAFIGWVRRLKFGEAFVPIDVPRFLQLSDRWIDPEPSLESAPASRVAES